MRCSLSTLLISTLALGAAEAADAPHAASDAAFKAKVAPVLTKYCAGCHGGAKPKGDLDLAKFADTASILAARPKWETLLEAVEAGEMPPKGKPRPDQAESAAVVAWLQSLLTSTDCAAINDPGRVTLRRLNRSEYNNTVKDLTDVDVRPADDFPSDDVGYGFDNIGDVLSIPPILFEKYMAAAEQIAGAAIVLDDPDRGKLTAFKASELPESEGSSKHANGRILPSNGEVPVTFEAPADGDYFLIVKAFGDQAGREPVRMEIRVDGKPVRLFDVTQTEKEPGRFEVRTPLKAGKRAISAAFTNDFYNPDDPNPQARDRNLVVEKIEIQGPAESEVKNLPRSHRTILGQRKPGQSDDEHARSIFERFATRAFRRVATTDEIDRVMAIYGLARKEGEKFERGIQLGLQATLTSPYFLFKIEYDRKSKDGSPVPITDFELATRLSYFLWSSMPDDTLLDLARAGKLKDDAVLEEQARRMLKSRKSRALVENFAGQWLQLRNLKTVQPDPKLFPDFDESLRAAMLKETEEYFATVMKEDRSILDFIDSDYTVLNSRMARYYRIKGFKPGKQDVSVKVTLTDDRRGGVLTQASVLTVTSNATRTSPVKRGKFILEQFLGAPPPPPPPDVPELKDAGVDLKATLRKRMEQHRADPNCAVCHAKLDPLGFGLENYDAIGSWREKEGEAAIDASGVLPSGQSFQTPKELKAILMGRSGEFTRCLAEKMMTYALGRGLDYHDRCAVDKLSTAVEKDGHKFSRLVVEIVKSDAFRKRRPKGVDQ
jgi:mono/diheme cytochrome c family protein